MPSYDTVSYWLSRELLKNRDLLSEIPCILNNVEERYCENTRQIKILGKHENFDFVVREQGIYLTGSICKYFLNDNQQALSKGDTIRANEKLSDNTHLPIDRATVLRVDIAGNFIVKQQEDLYYDYLGILPRFKRDIKDNGLYYYNSQKSRKNASIELLFYGKKHEQIIKGTPVQPIIENNYYLRYEARFLKRLCRLFNMPEITGRTITEDKFYIDIINKWKELYFTIQKNKITNFDLTALDMKKPKEYLEYYTLFGIMQRGGEAEALKEIEILQKRGIFKRKQVHDIRKKINEICKMPLLTMEANEISELDKDIKQAVKYYR